MISLALVNSQEISIALNVNGTMTLKSNLDFGRALDGDYLPFLENLLQEHHLTLKDVEGWSVALGPGSFAGIRFALALVKGIAGVTSAKTRGIPDSYAIASAYLKSHPETASICVMTDARCNCAFVTAYTVTQGKLAPVAAPVLLERTAEWPDWSTCQTYLTATPDVLENCPAELAKRTLIVPAAQAEDIIQADELLFPWLDSPDIEPLYVRPPA